MLLSSLLSRGLRDSSRSLCFWGPCPVGRDGLLGAVEFSREPESVISFASWESCAPRPGSTSRRASFFHRAAKSLARPPRSSWWRKLLTIFLTPVSCRMCGVRGKAESCCKYFWSLSGRVLVARRPCSLPTARSSTSSDAISVAGSASALDSVRCRSAGVSGPWPRLAACSGRVGAPRAPLGRSACGPQGAGPQLEAPVPGAVPEGMRLHGQADLGLIEPLAPPPCQSVRHAHPQGPHPALSFREHPLGSARVHFCACHRRTGSGGQNLGQIRSGHPG